ncbi:MAG: PAS domain-containing protein [Syntrophobacteraceae bacterium]
MDKYYLSVDILLVEDDEDDYTIVRNLLSDLCASGSKLHWVSDYDLALEAIQSGEFDVCLLDYLLGSRNGMEFLEEVTNSDCRTPVIFLTGQGDHNLDLEAMKSGAADYLSKDQLSAILLERAIRYTIEVRQKNEELLKAKMLAERRLAEVALYESEERLRLAMEATADGVWDWNIKTGEVFRSPSFFSMLGYRQEEFEGSFGEWLNHVHPDDTARVSSTLSEYLNGKREKYEIEFRMLSNSGSSVWILCRGKVVAYDETGKPARMVGTHTDITSRKQSEAALRESEARWQFAIEGADDGLWDWNVQSDEVFLSRQWKAMLGFEDHEIGTTMDDWDRRIHPRDKERVHADIKDHLDNRTPMYANEHCVQCKDGSYKWVLDRGKVIDWSEDGKPLRMIGTHSDITERKRAEAGLRNSEEYIRAVMDNLPIGVAVNSVDPAVDFTFMNNNFPKFYRTTKEALAESDAFWGSVYEDPVFREEIKKRVLDDCASGDPKRMHWEEVPITRNGEETTFISARNTLVPDKQLMISSVWDVTSRKRAEEEKEKLQAQLLQAQKMESVGRLAGGVAHDFNNMLGVIIGHTEMALDETNHEDSRYLDLQEIHKAARRSADLTRQLLAFARKQTVSPRVLNLNDTVSSMIKMLQRLIGEDIDLAWMPGHCLWSVKIDPSQVDQLLANLAVNARDAITGVGKITIETANVACDDSNCLSRQEFAPGEYVLLAVSDNGIGMDKEILDHIFEPFFTTKEVGKGTGLGLATIYGIVKQNQGFVHVYSEPGRGTTFRIYLPRFQEESMEQSTEMAAGLPPVGKETILIVEDEEAIMNLGKTILQRLGYTVLTASTPGKAIQTVTEYSGDIQLLITDVVMPEMNGRVLAEQLSSIKSGLKCLFMSGYTSDAIAHHGILDEGVHFIQKPFSVKEIAERVRETLDD